MDSAEPRGEERDRKQVVQLQAVAVANPSRRRLLGKIGAGVAGAALAYYGLSKFGAIPKSGRTRSEPAPGTMTYRRHPKSGDNLSLLGFGCMRLPVLPTATTPGSPEINEPAAIALIDHAIEHGVNFFDSAYPYHGGMSEVVMGKALKRHPRSAYFVNSKMPTGMNPTLEGAKRIFATQLQRCQIEYFDYYLLHGVMWTDLYKTVYEERGVLDYLLQEKAAGRIRNLGFSFHGDQECLEYLLSRDVAWDIALVQLNYRDLMREYQAWGWITDRLGATPPAAPKWILEKMTRANIPLMAMEPLLGGRLAKLNRKALAVLHREEPEASAASWAFRYVGSIPNVVTVLSGMTFMEHLQENIRTFSPLRPITAKEISVLDQALDLYMNPDIIPCTACGYCMPCPYGVDIPSVFAHYNNCLDDDTVPKGARNAEYERARKAYLVGYDRSVPELRQAERCTGCNKCAPKCPQQIAIPGEMARLGSYAEQLRSGR